MSLMRLVSDVINLDRRLFIRWLRGLGSETALPAAIGLVVITAQYDSAIQAGAIAREAGGAFTDTLVGLYAALSFLAAVTAGIALGELALARQLRQWLTLSAVPWTQRLTVVQALAVGSRHLIVTSICALPAVGLLWTIAEPGRALASIGALAVLLLTAPAVGRLAATALERLTPPALALATTAAIGALFGAESASLSVLALLPSHAVTLMVNGAFARGSIVLMAWVLPLLVAELLIARWGPLEPAARTARAHRSLPTPAWIATVARGAGCHGALLRAELLKLGRWRRVAVSVAVGAAFLALAIRISLRNAYLVPDVAVALAPCVIVGSLLANVFAIDGPGAQVYFLTPSAPVMAWRAKVASITIVALVLELGGWLVLASLGNLPTMAGAAFLACCAVAFLAWSAGIGGLLSVLFPRASDTRQFGGSLVAPEAALLWIPAVGLFVSIAAGAAYLFDSGRLPAAGLVLVGLALAAFSAFLLRTVDRILRGLLPARVELLTTALGAAR